MKNSKLHLVSKLVVSLFLILGMKGTLIAQNITITGPLVVGPGQQAFYQANFTYTINPLSVISWSCTGGTIVSQNVNPGFPIDCTVLWGNITGSYTLCIYETPPVGPSQSACITVKIVCGEADGGPNVTLCSGGCSIIGVPAQPGYTYSWTPTTGLSDPNIAQPIACPLTTTVYTVNMQSTNGCPVTQTSLTVTVNSTPTISPSSPINICTPWEYAPTNTSLLTSSTTSSGQYQWYKDGQSISGATSQTHYAQNYTQGYYIRTFLYTVQDPVNGCVSSPVTVNFVPTPLTPEGYTLLRGVWYTIEIVQGLPGTSYTWNVPNASLLDNNIFDPYVDIYFPPGTPYNVNGTITLSGSADCQNGVWQLLFYLVGNRNQQMPIKEENESNNKESKHFSLYPNPASLLVTVKSEEAITEVEILDINNAISYLKKRTSNNNTITLDISSLKPGVYLCKVVTKTKTEFLKLQVAR